MKKNAKKQKKNLLLPLAAAICLVSLTVMVFALSSSRSPQMGEFTPPPFDFSAVPGSPTVPQGLGWQELDAQVYKVGICGNLTAADSKLEVWLTNPAGNAVWLKVRVLDGAGNILGETGLLKPGEYVQWVSLDTVPPAGTSINLKIMAYEPETYYSAGAVTLSTTLS